MDAAAVHAVLDAAFAASNCVDRLAVIRAGQSSIPENLLTISVDEPRGCRQAVDLFPERPSRAGHDLAGGSCDRNDDVVRDKDCGLPVEHDLPGDPRELQPMPNIRHQETNPIERGVV